MDAVEGSQGDPERRWQLRHGGARLPRALDPEQGPGLRSRGTLALRHGQMAVALTVHHVEDAQEKSETRDGATGEPTQEGTGTAAQPTGEGDRWMRGKRPSV